jgi:RHS repeat-associated protein
MMRIQDEPKPPTAGYMTQRAEIGGERGYGEYSAREHFPVLLKRSAAMSLRASSRVNRRPHVSWTQEFNAENRLASISDGTDTWTFGYDGDGNRVKQVNPDGTITLFLGGGRYEVRDAAGDAEIVKYYAVAGQRIAMRDAEGVKYLLTDHLGSIVAVVDGAGELLEEQRYMPFGETRLAAETVTDFGFTGQRALEATGLMDYNARWYDAALGRFVSADSIVPGAGNSQALNRYAYVMNNPVIFIDPSGNARSKSPACDGPRDIGCARPELGGKSIRDVLTMAVTGMNSQGATTSSTSAKKALFAPSEDPDSCGILTEAGCEFYRTASKNTALAWIIINDPRAPYWARQLAISYLGLEAIGVASLGGAGVLLACSAVATCVSWAATTLGIGTAASLPLDNQAIIGHIFRDAPGHFLEATDYAKNLLVEATQPQFLVRIDPISNYRQYIMPLIEGWEIWVDVTIKGIIHNGGINPPFP